MKFVLLLSAVLVSFTTAQVVQNICRPTEVVFLLDHSENAKKASTYDGGVKEKLLKDAWEAFMNELSLAGDNLFRVWAFAYSSRANPIELVRRNSRPSQSHAPGIGQLPSGGSWTFKGLQQLRGSRPSLPNNVVIIVSAQGSNNTGRLQLAQQEYQDLRNNGWNTYVIGVKASQDIDSVELEAVNSQNRLVILDDGQPTNKKSYTLLGGALTDVKNTILCPPTIITTPRPTTTTTRAPIPTMPPSTGICSNCKVKGGYGFDRHPQVCDLFYQCLPDGTYVLKECGQSLIWDSNVGACVRSNEFVCPTGLCDAGRTGMTYKSGACCNMYFRCDGKDLVSEQCPDGQVYSEGNNGCVTVADPLGECRRLGSQLCNQKDTRTTKDCGLYEASKVGNPCEYYYYGSLFNVSAGTVWDQAKCQLIRGDACNGRSLTTRDLSQQCTAIVISTFNQGRPDAESQRDPTAPIYVQLNNVVRTQGSLAFPPNRRDTSAYYFFFNNNQISANSAFRMVFRLDDNANQGVVYDLFTNNFCLLCPETISATVTKTSASRYAISFRFTDNASRSVVTSTTQIDGVQRGSWLDVHVIWGESDIHGVVKTLSSSKAEVNQVQIQRVQHSPSSSISSNKCGILMGAGPNQNFMGQIDEFAYYTMCANIDDVETIKAVP